MHHWETILDEYLEGTGSRASAESLRFRIALPLEARREVETVLRLADQLADATRSVQPTAGAAKRLNDCLLLAGLPQARPNWVREGMGFAAPDGAVGSGAEDDAVNAAIEGVCDSASSISASRSVREGREHQQDLDAFQKIAAAVQCEASAAQYYMVPPGATDRLRSKLTEARERGEGGASGVVAARILAQLRGEVSARPAVERPPDVLAAGEETEDIGDQPTR